MKAGHATLLTGGAMTLVGSVLLYRGYKRAKRCTDIGIPGDSPECGWNWPGVVGIIMTPLGVATLTTGVAVTLIQSG
jgi:hypothetical protein